MPPASPDTTTTYTVMQDRRKGDPVDYGIVPQSPYTVPHHAIIDALIETRKQNKLEVIAGLRLTPTEFRRVLEEELVSASGRVRKGGRVEAAVALYTRNYQKTEALLSLSNRTSAQTIQLAHKINKCLQMDP
jgi:acyl-CoA synthetase (NDP forming)